MPAVIRTSGPSYIPSRQFAPALLDVVTRSGSGPDQSPTKVQDVLDGLTKNETSLPAPLVSAVKTLLADAGDDLQKAKAGIERWAAWPGGTNGARSSCC